MLNQHDDCLDTDLITIKDEEGNHKLAANEVSTIKTELVGLMTSVPPAIQSQLGEAVSVIADSDFWERWDYLVDVSGATIHVIPYWSHHTCYSISHGADGSAK